MIKLLIIGGGAVSESTHIPSAIKILGAENVYLAEYNISQLNKINSKYNLKNVFADYNVCIHIVDCVIIATPPHTHNKILKDCISASKPVLCEKPLSTDSIESRQIIFDNNDKVLLGMCHTYRLFTNRLKIRELIRNGYFGNQIQIEIQEGFPSSWPTISGYCFRKDLVTGGVLFDAGIHSLDFILWCMGSPLNLNYNDDENGGLESNANLEMNFEIGKASFRISRTTELANKILVSGNGNRAEIDIFEMNRYSLNGQMKVANDERILDWTNIGEIQIENFMNAIQNQDTISCSLTDGLKVVEVIESCYKNKVSNKNQYEPFLGKYKNKKILVTGGTGFIGSRIAERLVLEEGAIVNVMVHKWAKASWISRFDVNLIQADISNYEEVENAMIGCEVVFHCVGIGGIYENAYNINVEGTLNVLRACKKHGIKNIVYLSSVVVHGQNISDKLNADSQFIFTGDAYADSKIEAEKAFWEFVINNKINASVIRPTYVWGPLSEWYTTEYIKQMKNNSFYLVDRGKGAFNGVYIDNVVDLALICGFHPNAIGQSFIITDDQKIKWSDFLLNYAEMLKLNFNSFKSIPVKNNLIRKLLKYLKTQLIYWISYLWDLNIKYENNFPFITKWFCKAPRKLMKLYLKWILSIYHEKSAAEIAIYNQNSYIDISKVTKLLGYKPRFSVKDGMIKTKEWLLNQNYL